VAAVNCAAIAVVVCAGCLTRPDPISSGNPPPTFVKNLAAVLTVPPVQFEVSPASAGDLVVVHASCSVAAGDTLSVGAPGWEFVVVGDASIAGDAAATSFAAVAPDTSNVTVTVVLGPSPNTNAVAVLADEFSGTAQTTALAHNETISVTGPCSTSVTTSGASSTLWGACAVVGALAGPGPGFTTAGDDQHDDQSEYRQTMDPAGTVEMVTFVSDSAVHAITAVAIDPP
jgi:hypothetical protein